MKNATLETRKQEAVQTNEPRVTLDIKKITSNQKLIASMDTYVFNKAMFRRQKVKSEIAEIPAKKVNKEELLLARLSGNPIFIYKKHDDVYVAELVGELKGVASENSKHECSNIKYTCKRLSALSDEQGGCEKVRDKNKYIENYDWIEEGYQTFNTENNLFIVLKCQPCVPIMNK